MVVILLFIFGIPLRIAHGSMVIHRGGASDHFLRSFYVLAVLAIVSMSLQTFTLREIGGHTVCTTYVSGDLTNLVQESAKYLFWQLPESN